MPIGRFSLATFQGHAYTPRPATRAALRLGFPINTESLFPVIHASRDRRRMPWFHRLAGLLVLAALGLSTGCVQRRLTIRTNPPGALVYVDDYPIGTTPVSTDFIYYGTRKVRIVKSGYETLTVMQPIPTPWYQYPGLDFVSENLVPGEIRDERVVEYQLQPQIVVPSVQLLDRGENLRRSVPPPQMPVPGAAGPQFSPPGGPSYGPPLQPRPGLPASPPPTSRPGSLFPG